jgi:hypothetical protein
MPDIEELREKLISTPTPTPVSGQFTYRLDVRTRGYQGPWAKEGAVVYFNYNIRTFNAILVIEDIEEKLAPVRFLKNTKSSETITLTGRRYRIHGEFWRRSNPLDKIKVSFGEYSIKNQNSYTINLDRKFEQDLLYELEVRNMEKIKKNKTNRRRRF